MHHVELRRRPRKAAGSQGTFVVALEFLARLGCVLVMVVTARCFIVHCHCDGRFSVQDIYVAGNGAGNMEGWGLKKRLRNNRLPVELGGTRSHHISRLPGIGTDDSAVDRPG